MGDVIPLFRDRRPQPVPARKDDLHEHLRTEHGWGGPKSSTLAALKSVHNNSHQDPPPWWHPHRHEEGF